MFFFEKKNQKTFACLGAPEAAPAKKTMLRRIDPA